MRRLPFSWLPAALTALLLVPVLAVPAQADVVVRRAFGPDRIGTAVEVSREFRDTATDALLTTAFAFPDALVAGALAHRLDGPLLLTPPDEVPRSVTDEMARLGVRTVWILGGEGAVSAEVEAQLRALAFDVRRLAGNTRYETARGIAEAAGPSRTGEVILALGEHADPARAWPDAVASGALAATPDRVPTLLTRPTALPVETEQALATLRAREVIILGGESVVAPAVEQRLQDLGYTTRRIVSSSRYELSAMLAEDALSRFGPEARPAVFASGRAFPDALSAGALAASLSGPLMLVPPDSKLPGASERLLRDNAARLTDGVVVGGPASANEYVVAQLDAALQGEPSPRDPSQSSTGAPQPSSAPNAAQAPQPAPAPAAGPEQADSGNDTFTGDASWYGPGLEGNQTANGETFDPSELTAAHLNLPFDTILLVTNLNNGRQVEVRINDRGPYADDRVLDLSAGAAEVLRMKDDGVVPIRAEVLSYGS